MENNNNNSNVNVEKPILNNNIRSLGWLLIYVFAFGVNEIIVGKYIKSESTCLLYYIIIGIVGYLIISRHRYY
jgi:hypothetical protein